MVKQQKLYAVMALGGLVGVVAAFLQTLEKLTLLKGTDAVLTCDINSILSCTNVLNAWQSSVFGFPNSIMCLVLFTIFTVAAVAGLAGSTLSKGYQLGVQGLSLFTLGFSLWFLQQSTFSIKSICVYCLFCFGGLLLVNGTWLRVNAADLPLTLGLRKHLLSGIKKGADIFGWILLGLLLALVLILQFA